MYILLLRSVDKQFKKKSYKLEINEVSVSLSIGILNFGWMRYLIKGLKQGSRSLKLNLL